MQQSLAMWDAIRDATARGDIACDVRKNLFGGEGEVRVWQLMGPAVPPFDCALACELAPHASVGPHVQAHSSELVLFVEGMGEATASGNTVPVGAGSVVGLPHGATLSIRNSSDTPLRYFIIKASAPLPPTT